VTYRSCVTPRPAVRAPDSATDPGRRPVGHPPLALRVDSADPWNLAQKSAGGGAPNHHPTFFERAGVKIRCSFWKIQLGGMMVGLPPPPTSAGGGGLRTNPNRQPPTVPSQSYQGPQRHFLCLPIHACPPTLEHSHAPQTPNPLRDSSIFLESTTSATSFSLKNSQRFSLIRGKTNGAESPCNKPPPPPLRAHHVACVPFRRGEAGLRRSPTRRALPSPPQCTLPMAYVLAAPTTRRPLTCVPIFAALRDGVAVVVASGPSQ